MGSSNPNKEPSKRTGGPKTAEGKKKALANLRPAKPGEVRNPTGRPAAGASVREWWNIMQDWSLAEVLAVQNDLASPVNKLAAAAQWLSAATGNGSSTDRIISNTAGTPDQTVNVVVKDELSHVLDRNPELAELGNAFARRLAMANKPGGNGQSAN